MSAGRLYSHSSSSLSNKWRASSIKPAKTLKSTLSLPLFSLSFSWTQIEAISNLSSNPNMQSLRNLLIHNRNLVNLPKPMTISSLRSISSLQRSSNFLNRGWDDETKALGDPDRNPSPDFWNPFADSLEIPESAEKSQISTVSDPVQGSIVTKVDEEGLKPKEQEKVRVSPIGKRRNWKTRVSWVCESCGATTGQWWGSCPSCHLMGTVKQFSESEVSKARGAEVSEAAVRSWLLQKPGDLVPQSLKEVNKGRKNSEWRLPL